MDILTEEEKSHGKLPSLAPKDVAAAVLYAISVKENVQVINLSFFVAWKALKHFFSHHFSSPQIHEIKIKVSVLWT